MSFFAGKEFELVEQSWSLSIRASFSWPLKRTKSFLLSRIFGKVSVRRSYTANSLVCVCATGESVSFRAFEFGKREAVWPSWPMPKIVRSN